MKERPILFSAPMVRAILEGKKTQTRRILKINCPSVVKIEYGKHPFSPSALKGTPAEDFNLVPEHHTWLGFDWVDNCIGVVGDCPYGKTGDQLWVRETFSNNRKYRSDFDQPFCYKADVPENSQSDLIRQEYGIKWTPSIHMPRKASRIQLQIKNVRVESLNDISEADAKAEGCQPNGVDYSGYINIQALYKHDFSRLWESINGKGSWKSNPWVWVVEFERIKP